MYSPLNISVGDIEISTDKYLYPTGIFPTEGLIGKLSTKWTIEKLSYTETILIIYKLAYNLEALIGSYIRIDVARLRSNGSR